MAVNIPVKVIIDAVDNATKTIGGVGKSMGDLGLDMKKTLAVGAALGAGTTLLSKEFINQAGALEQNQIAFETMLGSAEQASKMLADIRTFAKKTPFNLTELVEGSKRLLAYNVEAEKLIPTMDVLGNITAGVGREKLPQLILAFGQVKAATKLTGAELRQFSEAGVPLLQVLADQAGVTAGEMMEMVSDGAVSFEMVEKALGSMTEEGGKFHNLMQKQSGTTLGKVSNMEDAMQQLSTTLGKALLPGVNKMLDRLIPLIESFGAWAEKNPDLVAGIMGVATGIGAISTVALALWPVVKGLTLGFQGLKLAMTAIKAKALMAAFAPLLANPITWVILAIVGAIALLALAWKNNWGDIQGKTQAVVATLTQWFTQFVTFMQNLWTGIVSTLQTVWNFFVAVGLGIVTAWQAVVAFFTAIPGVFMALVTSVQAFFTSLPELINQFIAGAAAAIYNFFVVQIPFAIGYMVGLIEKFFLETLPNAWNAMVVFFTETIPAWREQMIIWIVEMLVQLAVAIWNFATVTVPNAFMNMINWLKANIPVMANNFVNWIKDMGHQAWAAIVKFKDDAIATLINLKNQAIQKAIELYNSMVNWFTQMVNDVTQAMYNLPGNIVAAMNQVKEAAIGKAREIYSGVKEWFDKIVGFFNDIIGKAGEALSKAKEAFSAGRDMGRRQFGGSVSAASPVIVGEAGAEVFVPSTAGHIIPNNQLSNVGGGGHTTIVFNINSEMIINSPNERRGIAELLYKDLVTLARAQNTTVAEMLGA